MGSLDGETLVTPPLADHVLDSITRRRLSGIGQVTEQVDRARRAPAPREAFLASTPREVHRVRSIDGVALPPRPGRCAGAGEAIHEVIEPELGVSACGMRVLTVIGNRPQFVKAAAVSRPLRAQHEELLHTGQHHDDELSRSSSRARDPAAGARAGHPRRHEQEQTPRMLAGARPADRGRRPDAELVYGDTNSTLAGGLVAAQLQVPVAHVEAGMRSFDRAMPEELNRVVTDHLSDLLLCPSATAAPNLEREGAAGAVEVVGDVMVDVAELFRRAHAPTRARCGARRQAGEYPLVTAHRAGNVDDPARLRASSPCCSRLLLPSSCRSIRVPAPAWGRGGG